MSGAFTRAFLADGSARRLAGARIAFYGALLVQLAWYDVAAFATLPAALWRPPLLLHVLPAPTPGAFLVAEGALAVALVLAIVGCFTRVATIAVAVLATLVLGAVSGYGRADFHHTPIVLITWALALAPSGDAWSLDARRRGPPSGRLPADYTWPLRLAQACLVAQMASAGVNKVLGSWLQDPATAMRSFLLYKYYAQSGEKAIQLPGWVLDLAAQRPLLAVMAVGVMCMECASPLALVPRWHRLRFVVIGGLFGMQFVLAFFLSTLSTYPWLGAYAVWIPWDRIRRAPRAASLPDPRVA